MIFYCGYGKVFNENVLTKLNDRLCRHLTTSNTDMAQIENF